MPSHTPVLVVIGGATASGKTAAAAAIARHYGTEVINADSRQFYRAMRIGTARPAPQELLGVPHHFLGHLDVDTTWSAGAFARAAEPVLQDLLKEQGIAVLTGGSGLYIEALLQGLDPMPEVDAAIRERLLEELAEEGLPTLVERLHALDPVSWQHIDRQNPQRVVRALELCIAGGAPASALRTGRAVRTDLHLVRIALEVPRHELYARIDVRVDHMMHDGLLEEVRTLLPHRFRNALNTVGYKELFAHLDGAMPLNVAVDLIKQHTRNYAKRQLTWLRRDTTWLRFRADAIDRMIATIDAARTGHT